MKNKTTRRFLANNYNCRAVGYCDLWHLFRDFDGATYYTAGVYGWNFDAFCYGDKCITTGYRGMIGESVPREIVEKYEAAAKEIYYSRDEYATKREKLDALRAEFFAEAYKK